MTTKKKSSDTPLVLTPTEYKDRYTPEVLRKLLAHADEYDPRSAKFTGILEEVPKIREALGQETLTLAEVRENYAYWYAASRDPFPYQSDIDAGRDEFNAWLADHDANR